MLRNDLIVQMSRYDNDNMAVNVGGILIDVVAVHTDRGSVVLVLDPDCLNSVLNKIADEGQNAFSA